MLSETERKELDVEIEKYDHRQAAAVDALKILQGHRGWVSDEGIRDLSGFLNMTPDELDSVATFYPFIFRRPVGRHVIFICDSVVCWIMGYEGLLDHLTRKLGIGVGETTPDGRFTLLPVSCVGCCHHAPVLMIDQNMHEDIDNSKLDRILEGYF